MRILIEHAPEQRDAKCYFCDQHFRTTDLQAYFAPYADSDDDQMPVCGECLSTIEKRGPTGLRRRLAKVRDYYFGAFRAVQKVRDAIPGTIPIEKR